MFSLSITHYSRTIDALFTHNKRTINALFRADTAHNKEQSRRIFIIQKTEKTNNFTPKYYKLLHIPNIFRTFAR